MDCRACHAGVGERGARVSARCSCRARAIRSHRTRRSPSRAASIWPRSSSAASCANLPPRHVHRTRAAHRGRDVADANARRSATCTATAASCHDSRGRLREPRARPRGDARSNTARSRCATTLEVPAEFRFQAGVTPLRIDRADPGASLRCCAASARATRCSRCPRSGTHARRRGSGRAAVAVDRLTNSRAAAPREPPARTVNATSLQPTRTADVAPQVTHSPRPRCRRRRRRRITRVPPVRPRCARVERGRYLVNAMMCNDCHTPLALDPERSGARHDAHAVRPSRRDKSCPPRRRCPKARGTSVASPTR
jgi:hypothetical protein